MLFSITPAPEVRASITSLAFAMPNPHTIPPSPCQVAARMVGVFNSWRNYDAERGALMTAALRRMASANGISANVYEIVTKALP